MSDEKVASEAFRPVIESQIAFIQGALRLNVAMMQVWLGGGAQAADEERPSEAAKNPECMTP